MSAAILPLSTVKKYARIPLLLGMMAMLPGPQVYAYWRASAENGINDRWVRTEDMSEISLADMNVESLDVDNDGASNDEEAQAGTNPYVFDSDFDGVSDGDELHIVAPASPGISPLNWDSDGDYYSDHDEWAALSGLSFTFVQYEGGQLPAISGATFSDYDGDGTRNPWDAYPTDPQNNDSDSDGLTNDVDPVPESPDNFSSQNQTNWYSEALLDADGDGTPNFGDTMPYGDPAAPENPDRDGDSIGNEFDPYPDNSENYSSINSVYWYGDVLGDFDSDGTPNYNDSYPYDSTNGNPVPSYYGSADDDNDGIPNDQDPYPSDSQNYSSINYISWYLEALSDTDGDGALNHNDPYPNDSLNGAPTNSYTMDGDYDGVLDMNDPFPSDPSNYSSVNGYSWYVGVNEDTDGDAMPNYCDPYPYDSSNVYIAPAGPNDNDGDGIWSDTDPYPEDSTNCSHVNGTQWYADVLGDLDGDGTLNYNDTTPNGESESGGGITDTDGDGIADESDPFPADATNYCSLNGIQWNGDVNGDTDNDGVLNYEDAWPSDTNNGNTGATPVDTDGDGIYDDQDPFPFDHANYSAANGIPWEGSVLADNDQDGQPNFSDLWPYDSYNNSPDVDGDTFLNEQDPYPFDGSNTSLINSIAWHADLFGDSDQDTLVNWADSQPFVKFNGLTDFDGDTIPNIVDPQPADSSNFSTDNNLAWGKDANGDLDRDGLSNFFDPMPYYDTGVEYDSDNDGILDKNDPFILDPTNFSPWNNVSWNAAQWELNPLADADTDGLPNWLDQEPLSTQQTINSGTDEYGYSWYFNLDQDGDGIVDWEDPVFDDQNNYSPYNGRAWPRASVFMDRDNDSIQNWWDTEPEGGINYADIDGDYILNNTDPVPLNAQNPSPFNSQNWPGISALEDSDNDGSDNWHDGSPFDQANGVLTDSDSDGLSLAEERSHGTNDYDRDCDDDGLTDYEELTVYHSNPLNPHSIREQRGWTQGLDGDLADSTDTDGDSIPDKVETLFGLNPLNPADGDGDLDANGLTNHLQYSIGQALNADLVRYDADHDGMTDLFERYWHFAEGNPADAVQDRDGDGVLNFEEAKLGLSPDNPDSKANSAGGDYRIWLERHIPLEAQSDTADANTNGLPDWMDTLAQSWPQFYANSATQGDWDADGLPDLWEHLHGEWCFSNGLNLRVPDAGADKEFNGGDGLSNTLEYQLDTNPLLNDSDSDGLDDGQEDQDGDGLSNIEELALGTDLRNQDSDGDGITDANDDADGNGVSDLLQRRGTEDWDEDGLLNEQEIYLQTNAEHYDTDGDFLPDGFEVQYGFSPLTEDASSADSDGDSLTDLEESWFFDPYASPSTWMNPRSRDDLDDDKMPDDWERFYALNTSIDDSALDPDNDSLNNFEEYYWSATDPKKADSNLNGISDYSDYWQEWSVLLATKTPEEFSRIFYERGRGLARLDVTFGVHDLESNAWKLTVWSTSGKQAYTDWSAASDALIAIAETPQAVTITWELAGSTLNCSSLADFWSRGVMSGHVIWNGAVAVGGPEHFRIFDDITAAFDGDVSGLLPGSIVVGHWDETGLRQYTSMAQMRTDGVMTGDIVPPGCAALVSSSRVELFGSLEELLNERVTELTSGSFSIVLGESVPGSQPRLFSSLSSLLVNGLRNGTALEQGILFHDVPNAPKLYSTVADFVNQADLKLAAEVYWKNGSTVSNANDGQSFVRQYVCAGKTMIAGQVLAQERTGVDETRFHLYGSAAEFVNERDQWGKNVIIHCQTSNAPGTCIPVDAVTFGLYGVSLGTMLRPGQYHIPGESMGKVATSLSDLRNNYPEETWPNHYITLRQWTRSATVNSIQSATRCAAKTGLGLTAGQLAYDGPAGPEFFASLAHFVIKMRASKRESESGHKLAFRSWIGTVFFTSIQEALEFAAKGRGGDFILDADLAGSAWSNEDSYSDDPLMDIDTDGDGISDGLETNQYGTDPYKSDTDDGGVQDGVEISLGNTLVIVNGQPVIQDPLDPSDDTPPDEPLDDDLDDDGLNIYQENELGTDPNNPDTDGDGWSDSEELRPNGPGTNPSLSDTDEDGVFDDVELLTTGLDPLDPDSDNDFLPDGKERDYSTDWTNPDTDGDGLKDGDEVALKTSPLSIDTDRDTIPDGDEASGGGFAGFTFASDPTKKDSDSDGLNDDEEFYSCTEPLNPDTDGDGAKDGAEVDQYHSDPLVPDEDSDGVPDGLEKANGMDISSTDSDNDQLTDFLEVYTVKTDPTNPDYDGGGRKDGLEWPAFNPFDPSDDGGTPTVTQPPPSQPASPPPPPQEYTTCACIEAGDENCECSGNCSCHIPPPCACSSRYSPDCTCAGECVCHAQECQCSDPWDEACTCDGACECHRRPERGWTPNPAGPHSPITPQQPAAPEEYSEVGETETPPPEDPNNPSQPPNPFRHGNGGGLGPGTDRTFVPIMPSLPYGINPETVHRARTRLALWATSHGYPQPEWRSNPNANQTVLVEFQDGTAMVMDHDAYNRMPEISKTAIAVIPFVSGAVTGMEWYGGKHLDGTDVEYGKEALIAISVAVGAGIAVHVGKKALPYIKKWLGKSPPPLPKDPPASPPGIPISHEPQAPPSSLPGGARSAPTKLWSNGEFNGTRVYQRNDLIDPALMDARGRTNLQRMRSGLAPIGPDGKSLHLHHTIQSADSPLAEMTATFHQQNSAVIHINPNTMPSGIDRKAFDSFRRDYWMNRANDFSP